jgi:pimeloyl-ACP methyl ester carboxylesterase
MRRLPKLIPASAIALTAILLFAGGASAADYQFSVPTGPRDSRAFLWIPPGCQHVRGILLASQVILEKRVCDDPVIRAACARENLAIVILFHSPFGEFHYHRDLPREKAIEKILDVAADQRINVEILKQPPAGTDPSKTATYETPDQILQRILDELADESGYAEIASAPLLTLGHSGGAIFAWNVAYCWPQRILGVIGLHSAVILPPPWDPKASPAGFPALCISGEFESWGNPREPLDKHWRWLRGGILNMRGCYDAQACEVVQPGSTHFNWDEPLAQVTAKFIEKAAHYRISDDPGKTAPAALKTLPMDSGWLTDITMLTPSRYPPAAYSQFQGDPSLAFWHMDEELARAIENFPSAYGGKKDQRVTFVQDGKPIPASWIENVKFEPLEDGMSVKLAAVFLNQTPQGVAGAGQPIGHADGPIKFRLIGGWGGGGEQTGPDTFRIRFDNFGLGQGCCNMQVMAYQPGDATFKHAEQPCQIQFPEKNTAGQKQTITFPPIGKVKSTDASVPLHATSDSKLPVSYLVRSGPAEVDGDNLRLTAIPPRCKFPIKVTVVAYQWGRPIAPLVQTAEPVEQVFFIEKP